MDGITGQISSRPHHDEFSPQMMVCLVREILLFSGKSGLVKYYTLTRWYGILHYAPHYLRFV